MQNTPFRRRPLIEDLEPRLLFSADLAPVALDGLQPAPEQRVLNEAGEFSETTATPRHELVIVDTGVADYTTLLDDILTQAGDQRQLDVVILDSTRDGIAQLSEVLAAYKQLDALHVIAHGAAGELQLGNQRIDAASLDARAADISAWQQAFNADADLLLYGCDIASGSAGEQWISALSQLTGTEVAASTNLTGNPAQQGDWTLEAQTGAIESSLLLGATQTVWQGTLNINTAPGQTLANTPAPSTSQATTPSSRQVAINPDDGSFVVVWTGSDGNGSGIYLRQFNADGTPNTAEIQVNSTTSNDQINPDLAMNANGEFVVVWQSSSSDGDDFGISGQRFNAAAVAQGAEFLINATTSDDQIAPSVAIDGNGGFVVAWESKDANGSGIYAQRFDNAGNKIQTAGQDEFLVNSETDRDQTQPAVAMNSSGAFVIVWTSQDQSGDEGQGLYAALYSASGAVVAGKSEFRISSVTNGNQFAADVAMNAAGNFVVAYTDDSASILIPSLGSGVYVSVFDNVGALLNTFPVYLNQTTVGDQKNASVTISNTGDFLVAWESENKDGSGYGIVARHYKSNATAYANEQTINIDTAGDQRAPSVAWNGQQAVFVWSGSGAADGQGVYFRQAEINTPPVITSNGGGNSAAISVPENTTAVTTVTATDIDGHTPSFSLSGGADASKFTIDPATGTLSFQTAPDYESPTDSDSNRFYQVTVRVEDGHGGSDTQNISVEVTNGSDAPVLNDDVYSTNQLLTFTVAAPGLLDNEKDIGPDNVGLNVTSFTQPSLGSVVVYPDGSFTYTPDLLMTGQTSFTYTARNNAGNSSTATVYINVTLFNTAPTTSNVDLGNLDEDSIRLITRAQLLGNANDFENDNLNIVNLAIASGGGTLVSSGSNVWSYTPALNNTGSVTFSYRVSDGNLDTAGSASLNLTPVNDAPTTSSIPDESATEDTPYSFQFASTVFADVDTGDTLTYTASGLPAWLTFDAATRTFSGTPDNSDVGTVTIMLQATDTAGETAETAFNLTVVNTNDAPVITSNGGTATANLTVVENSTIVTTMTATDPDTPAQTLSYAIIGGVDAAQFSIDSATGVLSFMAAPDYEIPTDAGANRIYDIVVEARDGASGTDTQTLSIQITDIANTLTVTTPNDVLDGDTSSIEALVANKGTDGFISLREAISATNNTTGDDFITLPAGLYTLSLAGANENTNSNGDLDINGNLTITGAGPGVATVSGNNLYRVFDIIGGSVSLSGLTIQDGQSNTEGGGIFVGTGASLNLNQAVVRNNSAGSAGGGIVVKGGANLDLDHVVVSGNNADYGGGIYAYGTMAAIDSSIDANSASQWGGGIYSDRGTVNLERVTVSNNSAGKDGGGLCNFGNGAVMDLLNTTVSGNTAAGLGGGLYTNQDVSISNSTIAYNSAADTGGIYIQNPGSATLQNSIVAWNTNINANRAVISLGHNIDSGSTLGLSQPGDQSNTNPMLGALAGNGGTTQTHALLAGSAAINAGSSGAPATDQRGVARDALSDIGAYEYESAGAPAAVDDAASGAEDKDITGNVLANDTDAENDPLTAILVSGPANGTLTFNTDGSFTYTPDPGWSGTDSFSYKASDGARDSNVAAVALTVSAVNAPAFTSTPVTAATEDAAYSYSITASDADGDSLSITAATLPAWLTLTDNGDGTATLTGTPANASVGDHNVVLQVSDGSLSASQSFTITATNTNDAPTSSNTNFSMPEDTTYIGNLPPASDADGDAVTYSLATAASHGSIDIGATGSYTYTPATHYYGSDSFTYAVSDGHGGTSQYVVNLSVAAINDAPSLAIGTLNVPQGETVVLSGGLLQASDVDNAVSELTYMLTAVPAEGTLALNGAALAVNGTFTQADIDSGRVTYTHTSASATTDSLNIKVVDATSGETTGVLNLTISSPPPSLAEAGAPMPELQPEPAAEPPPAEPEPSMEKTAADSTGLLPSPLTENEDDKEKANGFLQEQEDGRKTFADPYRWANTLNPVQIAFNSYLLQNEAPATTPLLATLNRALDAIASDMNALESLKISLGSDSFQQQLNQLQEEIRQQLSLDKNTVASTFAVSTGLSVGYVLWLVRGGVLLSSLLSTLPAWRLIDPLPILGHLNRQKRGDYEDDSLEGMLKKSANKPKPQPVDQHTS